MHGHRTLVILGIPLHINRDNALSVAGGGKSLPVFGRDSDIPCQSHFWGMLSVVYQTSPQSSHVSRVNTGCMIDESEKLYRETLKAQGKLAEDYRDDWQLPKALRPRKSLKRDKAALDDLRTAPKPAKPAWAEIDTPDTVEDGGEAEDGETEENSSETTNVTGIHNYADMGVSDVGVGADGGEDDPSEDDTAELGGVDDIAWNRQELKRLRDLKRVISDEYCALKSADKDTQAFYDKKLKMIESQESACVENLKLFNKKRLEAGAVANLVRLEIVPWQGDGTSPVQTWV